VCIYVCARVGGGGGGVSGGYVWAGVLSCCGCRGNLSGGVGKQSVTSELHKLCSTMFDLVLLCSTMVYFVLLAFLVVLVVAVIWVVGWENRQ
jgi:hypothetical protein